jgi:hypothetical protein
MVMKSTTRNTTSSTVLLFYDAAARKQPNSKELVCERWDVQSPRVAGVRTNYGPIVQSIL